MKELKTKDEKAFALEVKVLKKLSSERHTHSHLITLLATYRYNEAYHLIFPWADMDLFGYWSTFREASKDASKGRWVVEQCRGLVDGLHKIHRYETYSGTSLLDVFQDYIPPDVQEDLHISTVKTNSTTTTTKHFYGRHGDLKPENILWFPPSQTTGKHGILKITDFGIARFSAVNLWDAQKTGRVPNSPSYRSPEYDLDGKLSTACDVWALGCVYLEFLTWYFRRVHVPQTVRGKTTGY